MKFNTLFFLVLLLLGMGLVLALSWQHPGWRQAFMPHRGAHPRPKNFYDRLAFAAEDIVDPGIVYDPQYVRIRYPGGMYRRSAACAPM